MLEVLLLQLRFLIPLLGELLGKIWSLSLVLQPMPLLQVVLLLLLLLLDWQGVGERVSLIVMKGLGWGV